MTEHRIVDHQEWVDARRRLLDREKAFTHEREALSEERRALPWEEVEVPYAFEGDDGRLSLADLFDRRSQLIVYHFMFEPDWDIGCRGCSFWADNFDRIVAHLAQRDVSFVATSRAPLSKLREQARRFGWTFPWFSCVGDAFNHDFNVGFSPDELARGEASYNYGSEQVSGPSKPGISVFAREGERVFHTYSTYGRGLDIFNTAYHYLDIAPKGRDEEGLSFPMAWVDHRIAYDSRRAQAGALG